MASVRPTKRRRRRFCWNCPWRSRLARPHACARSWKPDGSSTTPCSRDQPAPPAAHTSRSNLASSSRHSPHPQAGAAGGLFSLTAIIDWNDPVVKYGLGRHIKYVRLIQRKGSPKAQGADAQGFRYFVQLALEGVPFHKPKHAVGTDTLGIDLGPSTIALVPRQTEASLQVLCADLAPDEKQVRRLQRKMDRQRRAANPGNYDEKGRIRKAGSKQKLRWKSSKTYEKTRRRKAAKERRLSAHRKSLHGQKIHEIVAIGNAVILEKISYKAWQKQYGRSVGLRAPGMFIQMLRRTGAAHGRHPARSFDAHNQTQPVLPRLRQDAQKNALTALAPLRMRCWPGAA
jgi:hypothetical protein